MANKRLLLLALSCAVVPTTASTFVAGTATAAAAASETKTLPGGAVVTFSKGAKYSLGRPIKLQLALQGKTETLVQVVKFASGEARLTLPDSKAPKTAVLFQGPRKVSAIAKGGESLVIATPERVTVAAVSGEMLAALGDDWKPLAAGKVRSFAAGSAEEQLVPAAPVLEADRTMVLALDGSATVKLSTPPALNLDHRELSVYRRDGAQRTPLRDGDWRADTEILPGLTPGVYEVAARAVDRFGVTSAQSPRLDLRVIGVELPEGARVSGESILIGRSARVKLIGAAGLEASYGRATLFIPAPADVGLARGESTLLRLREPGKTAELGVQLEPRTLRADVTISPQDATWPKDQLDVYVKLFDRRGRPVSEPLKSKPQVFVNVDPIAAEWSHDGNTWSAKVSPAAGPGPWVVRVEVSDDFGDAIGRNFMELKGTGT